MPRLRTPTVVWTLAVVALVVAAAATATPRGKNGRIVYALETSPEHLLLLRAGPGARRVRDHARQVFAGLTARSSGRQRRSKTTASQIDPSNRSMSGTISKAVVMGSTPGSATAMTAIAT